MNRATITLGALGLAGSAMAEPAHPGIEAFVAHCFTRGMTPDQAAQRLTSDAFDYSFYDTTIAPSADAEPGVNRICAVRFDGDHTAAATDALIAGIEAEGWGRATDLPEGYAADGQTAYIAARRLQSGPLGVVEVRSENGQTAIIVRRLARQSQ